MTWLYVKFLLVILILQLCKAQNHIGHEILIPGTLGMSWTLNRSDSTVTITLEGATTGWVAVGIANPEQPTMMGGPSDAYVGWVTSSGEVIVHDHWLISHSKECPGTCEDTETGGTNDILTFSGSEMNGNTTITFTRRLDTGDQTDRVIQAIVGQSEPIIYGVGPDDEFTRHTDRGSKSILWHLGDVLDENSTSPSSLPDSSTNPSSSPLPKSSSQISSSSSSDILPSSSSLHIPSSIDESGEDGFGPFFSTTLLDGKYRLSWRITDDLRTIEFLLAAQTTSWVSIGFPEIPGRMVGCDVIAGWVDENGKTFIKDFYITAKQAGCPGVCEDKNTDNSLQTVYGSEENGVTTLIFRKILFTQKRSDTTIKINKDIDMIVAIGPNNNENGVTSIHQSHQSFRINLQSSGDSDTITISTPETPFQQRIKKFQIAHAVFMFFAWGLLFPFGIFIASIFKRFTYRWKTIHPYWFRLHIFLQMTGIVFAVIGMILAVTFVGELNNDHFYTTHTQLGLTTLILMAISPYLGVLADAMWKDGKIKLFRKTALMFSNLSHWFFGYSAQLLAIPTLILGFRDYDGFSNSGSKALAVLVGIWFFLLISLWIVGRSFTVVFQVKKWRQKSPETEKIKRSKITKGVEMTSYKKGDENIIVKGIRPDVQVDNDISHYEDEDEEDVKEVEEDTDGRTLSVYSDFYFEPKGEL